MRAEDFDTATIEQLQVLANKCFEIAQSPLDEPPIHLGDDTFDFAAPDDAGKLRLLLEAQFYLTAAARKRADEAAERDRKREHRRFLLELFLEVVIISLIGWEIREGRQQARALEHMDTSTAATATLLKTLTDQQRASLDTQNKQLDAAKESEAQAGRSANAAERSASVSSQTLHVSERAYVGIYPSPAKPPAAGERLQFVATLNNSGRTPALEMMSHVTLVVTYSSESEKEVYAEVTKARSSSPSGSESIGTLWPGATAKNIAETTLTQPELDQIIEGKVLIRIFANASYKDVFGQSHYTEICYFYKPAGNAFSPCHEFNKSD